MKAMRILITSGGTSERIDEVRVITNFATGRLGAAIAESLSARGGDAIERLYYVHGRNARLPSSPRTELVPIVGVSDLLSAVESVASSEKIDVIVHAMAVSDYALKRATTIRAMAESVAGPLKRGELEVGIDDKGLSERIATLIRDSGPPPGGAGKIGSDFDDLALVMWRTPKVIARFRELCPGAAIVGFKLLSGADERTLVAAGLELLRKNGCSYVFANDSHAAFGSGYAGYLISPDGSFETLEGMGVIADAVAKAMLGSRGSSA